MYNLIRNWYHISDAAKAVAIHLRLNAKIAGLFLPGAHQMTPEIGSEFDPYRIWLSIPLEELPANHYRLLGIPLFENNPQIIQAAADRQMIFLKTFQNGQHAGHSQRLLNEVSLAAVTLLNLETKRVYDSELNARLTAPAATPTLPVASPLPGPLANFLAPLTEPPNFALDLGADPLKPGDRQSLPQRAKRKEKNPAVELIKIVAGGLGGLTIAWLFLWLIGMSGRIDDLFFSPVNARPVAAKQVRPTTGENEREQATRPPTSSQTRQIAPSQPLPTPVAPIPQRPLEPELRLQPPRVSPSQRSAADSRLTPFPAIPPTQPSSAQRAYVPPVSSMSSSPPSAPSLPTATASASVLNATERRLWVYVNGYGNGHFWKEPGGGWFELTHNMDTWRYAEVGGNQDYIDLQRSDCPVVVRLYHDRSEVSNSGSPFDPLFKGRFTKPVASMQRGGGVLIAERACENFEQELKDARRKLIDAFEIGERTTRVAKLSTEIKISLLNALKAEKARFEKEGLIPWSLPMRTHSGTYLEAVNKARGRAEVALNGALDSLEMQGNESLVEGFRALKLQVLSPLPIARIHGRATRGFHGEFSYRLLCNGKLNDPTGSSHWTTQPGALVLHVSINGVSIRDFIPLADNGKAFSATNNVGGAYEGWFGDQLLPQDVLPNRLELISKGDAVAGKLPTGTGSVSGQELVKNGSFEQPQVGIKGEISITPIMQVNGFEWDVEEGDVEVFGCELPALPGKSKHGIQHLDLNGRSIGILSQTLKTVKGTKYTLRFWYSNNYSQRAKKSFDVDVLDMAGDVTNQLVDTQSFSHDSAKASDLNWKLGEILFAATSDKTTIRFTSTYKGGDYWGILLDDVSVKPCSPESESSK